MTSANTSVRIGNRFGVHATLISIVTVLGTYYIFTSLRAVIISPVKFSLWIITLWIAISTVYHSNYDWNTAIHFGLSCLWILIYHFFSYYLRRYPEAIAQVRFNIGVMFCFYVFSAVYAMVFIHAHLVKVGQDRLAVVNLVYSVMVFVPWLSILKNRKQRLIGIAIVLLVVLGSMKRGAIIAFPMMLSTWMLVEAAVERKNLLRPALKIIFSLLLFAVGLLVADQVSGGFLSDRFSARQLADGSGRAGAFSLAFKDLSEWSFAELMLGTGKGFFSHNDWFEFLYLYGIIGVILYASLFCSIFFRGWQLIRKSSQYAPAVAMTLVYTLLVGMFGAIYFVHSTLYLMALLGTVEALTANDNRRVALELVELSRKDGKAICNLQVS